MGLSSSSITVITFSRDENKTKGKLEYKGSSKFFGTRYFDDILMKKFSKEFCDNTQLDPLDKNTNKNIKLRLLQAVEKARKQLTSNYNAEIYIDPLMSDQVFETNIS